MFMVHAPESRCITRSTTESPQPCSSGRNDRHPNSAASECHQEGCSSCSRFVIFLVSGVCPIKLSAQHMGTRYSGAFYETGFRNCSQAALIRWIYSDWQEQQCLFGPLTLPHRLIELSPYPLSNRFFRGQNYRIPHPCTGSTRTIIGAGSALSRDRWRYYCGT